jgi:hypothetical protein
MMFNDCLARQLPSRFLRQHPLWSHQGCLRHWIDPLPQHWIDPLPQQEQQEKQEQHPLVPGARLVLTSYRLCRPSLGAS